MSLLSLESERKPKGERGRALGGIYRVRSKRNIFGKVTFWRQRLTLRPSHLTWLSLSRAHCNLWATGDWNRQPNRSTAQIIYFMKYSRHKRLGLVVTKGTFQGQKALGLKYFKLCSEDEHDPGVWEWVHILKPLWVRLLIRLPKKRYNRKRDWIGWFSVN